MSSPTVVTNGFSGACYQHKTTAYFMAVHFFLAFNEIVLVAPILALLEAAVCQEYYDFHSNIHDCKIPAIQSHLAKIRGVKAGLDGVVVLMTAIPFGRLGDRIGRRKVLAISLIGVLISLCWTFVVCLLPSTFPAKLIWLSSALLLMGGGLNPASAYMWAMASESIPSRFRSNSFYYIFSAFYLAELLASFIASVTMKITPWIPASFAVLSLILCLLLLAFNKPFVVSREASAPEASEDNGSDSVTPLLPKITNDTTLVDNRFLVYFLTHTRIQLLLPAFAVGIFRYPTLAILIQYSSVRFGSTISSGALFYTETAATNIALFLFLVPQSTEYLRSCQWVSSQQIDLGMLRLSLLAMSIGTLLLGLISKVALLPLGVLIYSLGFGSRVAALNLITQWIPRSSTATVYAGIVVLESLGHAIGDPALGYVYGWGLERGGAWQASPFFFAFLMYGIALCSVSFIGLEKPTDPTTQSMVDDSVDRGANE